MVVAIILTDFAGVSGDHVSPIEGVVTLSKEECEKLPLVYFQATATAARHMIIADERKVRCVLAEVRWRWTLKVL
jgi:hypothetical protein